LQKIKKNTTKMNDTEITRLKFPGNSWGWQETYKNKNKTRDSN